MDAASIYNRENELHTDAFYCSSSTEWMCGR